MKWSYRITFRDLIIGSVLSSFFFFFLYFSFNYLYFNHFETIMAWLICLSHSSYQLWVSESGCCRLDITAAYDNDLQCY